MLILTIRTDKPEAELGLYDGEQQLAYETWQAHRELSETIHSKIKALLDSQHKDWHDIAGVLCYKGPGSFTGLRIGLTVGNALAANLGIPILGASGNDWREQGVQKLLAGSNDTIALPDYGRDAHITKPRK